MPVFNNPDAEGLQAATLWRGGAFGTTDYDVWQSDLFGKKKKKDPPTVPDDPTLPEDTSCVGESFYRCWDCPAGLGRLVEKVPVDGECLTIIHDLCVATPLCPSGGPIDIQSF